MILARKKSGIFAAMARANKAKAAEKAREAKANSVVVKFNNNNEPTTLPKIAKEDNFSVVKNNNIEPTTLSKAETFTTFPPIPNRGERQPDRSRSTFSRLSGSGQLCESHSSIGADGKVRKQVGESPGAWQIARSDIISR